jgi:hypothetical protein
MATVVTTGTFLWIHSTIGSFSEKIQKDLLGTAENLGVEPMRSNQTMERTATRFAVTFRVTTTFSLRFTRGLGGRRSFVLVRC